MITQDRLKELMHYDPDTGLFTWATKAARKVVVGSRAGSAQPGDYVVIKFDSSRHQAHRLAWLYMTGELPTLDVDHINGDRQDNRWSNLREVSRSENLQNQRRGHQGSTSPLLGVSWSKSRNKWVAQIRPPGGETTYLGAFATQEEAHQAYLNAKRELHAGCTI